jgi:hypothetical protein
MLNADCPALLAPLSFLLTTNLSDTIFGDVLGAPQTLTRPTSRDAFLARVIAALDESQHALSALRSPISLSLEGLTLGLARGGEGGAAPRPGLSPRKFGVITRDRSCQAFPRWNAWFKQVRGTTGTPKCRLRSYDARYCPVWSGTSGPRPRCWYAEPAWEKCVRGVSVGRCMVAEWVLQRVSTILKGELFVSFLLWRIDERYLG